MELSANISYEALHGAPPACEPERQQYFMEKAKKQLEVFKDRLGRPQTWADLLPAVSIPLAAR